MDRRDFIKLCSLAGLGVVSSGIPSSRVARAEAGRFWVFVHAVGGWDHTLLLDPKGGGGPTEDDYVPNSEGFVVNRAFATDDIMQAGNLTFAPSEANATFFNRFRDQTLIIRGIDCETNGHDSGQRNTWSGRLVEGTPAFAALLAATEASSKPMSFITNGGYDYTDGNVAPTRLGNNIGALTNLIYPNRISLDGNGYERTFHTPETFDRIMEYRQERTDRALQLQNLPRIKQAVGLLYTSRVGMGDLKRIDEYLPDQLGNGLARQAIISLAAYKAGLTASANLAIGGFDTHGNNDQATGNRMGELVQGITDLYNRAEELNIADELTVVVGSDFGRTPRYNDGNGKDHWSVGSMMVMGKGINGNRVVGETDDTLRYKTINPNTLAVDESASGMAIKNAHVHKWLRKLSGIEGSEVARNYPISEEGEIDFNG